MPFDPDAYLASKQSPPAFDPDAYLAEKAAQTQPQVIGRMGRASAVQEEVTGATQLQEDLPELSSSGLLSGEDKIKVAALSPVLLTTTDPDEIGKIITSQFPNVGMTYNLGADGKPYPILVNNATGVATQINKPGLSGMDVLQGLGLAAAFTPAGRVVQATTGLMKGAAIVGGKSAATEAVMQSAQELTGGEFDGGDVAMAGGFGVAGKFAEAPLSAGARAIKGQAGGKALAAREFAEETGSPLMTTDIAPPSTFFGKSAQAAGEKIPVAGTGGARAEQQEARSKLVSEYVDSFGEYNPADVYKSLKEQTSKVKRAAGKRRGVIVDKVADVIAITPESKAIESLSREIDKLAYSPNGVPRKTADTQTIDKLQGFMDDLQADPTFANLEQLRTVFRETVKGERMVLPGRTEAALESIYSSMTKDMDGTVLAELGEQTASKWKAANRIYAEQAGKIKDTRLKSVLQKGELTPEVVNNLLYSKKPSEFKLLYGSLNAKGKASARSGLIAKAAEVAKGSPDKFLTEIKKLSNQTGISFKGEDKRYLQGLKSYLGATRRAGEAGTLTKSGEQLFQIGAPVAVVGDIASTGGAGTTATAMYGLMARAYESAPIRNLMMRLASAPKGSTKADRIISELQPLLTGGAQSQKEQVSL